LCFRPEVKKETEVIQELGSLDHRVLLGPRDQLQIVILTILSTFQFLDLQGLQAIQ
jgi:hypothetical protein